jgi:hypothetical protein
MTQNTLNQYAGKTQRRNICKKYLKRGWRKPFNGELQNSQELRN